MQETFGIDNKQRCNDANCNVQKSKNKTVTNNDNKTKQIKNRVDKRELAQCIARCYVDRREHDRRKRVSVRFASRVAGHTRLVALARRCCVAALRTLSVHVGAAAVDENVASHDR